MTTLHLAIIDGADDGYQQPNGTPDLTTSPSINVDATNEWFGWRFQNVTIPQGSTINSAVLSVVPTSSAVDEPDHPIWGEDVDDAAALSIANNNISARATTTATVTWSSTDLGATGSSRHSTPDLSTIIQEIVDRAGWVSGNSLVLVMRGSADANRDLGLLMFESGGGVEANLDIDYTAPASLTEGEQMAARQMGATQPYLQRPEVVSYMRRWALRPSGLFVRATL